MKFQEYRHTGCQFAANGLVGELKDILEETQCRLACAEPGPCEHYVYNKDTEMCFLYEGYRHHCRAIVGPPNDNYIYTCLVRFNETMVD